MPITLSTKVESSSIAAIGVVKPSTQKDDTGLAVLVIANIETITRVGGSGLHESRPTAPAERGR